MKHRIASLSFALVFFFVAVPAASAATLSFSPSSGNYTVGNIFNANIVVDTGGVAINNADATISFPTSLLEVISVSKSSSIFPLWVEEPSYSNNAGTISFNGGVPTPGYTGRAGHLLTVTFRIRNPGSASLVFSSASVRANDGYGTDVLTATSPATFSIKEGVTTPTSTPTPATPALPDLFAHITSSSHPDQTAWYARTHAVFDWTNAQNATAVKLGYDTNANGAPTVLYQPAISHKELDLADGIWYFHVAEKGANGWGPIATYRIQIDTASPAPVIITFPNGATTSTSTIAVSFTTTDALSGIDRYVLSVDGTDTTVSAADGAGVYALPAGANGSHTLAVIAYDKAGNSVTAEQQFTTIVEKKVAAPAWGSFAWLIANYFVLGLLILLVLIALLFIAWYLWHRFHAFRRRVVNKEERMHVLIHRQFNELKSAVADEISALEDIKSRRKLSLEEERLINRLQKLIDQSEHTIDKEIDSVLNK